MLHFILMTLLPYFRNVSHTQSPLVHSHDAAYDLYDLLEEDALTRLRDADCMSASDTDDDTN